MVSIAIGSEKDQPFLPLGAPDRKVPGAGNTEDVLHRQCILIATKSGAQIPTDEQKSLGDILPAVALVTGFA
ncbi:hypothetical protein AS026_12865 [Rhizobium altiplani]|uniref:Uncharacterized protein n=1 Tax=Rhizobium altiplani TaxID=1864509 RepID=A0A109JFL4_9HYPH|nr:hypothetical protein AS026_12865 [Rhizobium altiplani]